MENSFYSEFDTATRDTLPTRDGEYRTPFQRDRDGVIYSSAFRRLQAKTQVFLSGQYDFYRTRLTHSIEVAQIGRSICNRLTGGEDSPLSSRFHVDQDLVEAICLTHDLGHPPYGHAGERTLHRLMRESYGGFEGNAQSLRIITDTIYSAGERRRGLNPTRAFVDGILKYKRLWSEDTSAENHFLYDDQAEWRDFALPEWRERIAPGVDPNLLRSIECQIMDWADDTAYSLNDVADGVNAGFLEYAGISRWAEKRIAADPEAARHLEKLLDAVKQGFIDAWAGKRIGQFISACSVTERDTPLSGQTNRYRFGLAVDPGTLHEASLYKALSVDLVFKSSKIKQLEYKGDYILERIFRAIESAYAVGSGANAAGLLPDTFQSKMTEASTPALRARLLCDYLAGMTDGFATRTFKRLFDPDFGSIAELA